MSQTPIQKILDQIDILPALPATVTRVLATTSDPESSARDLMQAILPDQTMCAEILKIANSAAFGLPHQVNTLERALMVLGFDEVKNIIISKAIFASFPKMDKISIQGIGVFWEHAFTCGLMSKIIGQHYRLSPSELFICGLIHDIGKLVMLMAFPSSYPILQEHSLSSHFSVISTERELYGTSHDHIGLELARRWALPEQIAYAIGFHHVPETAPAHRQHPLIVQIADLLSMIYCCTDISEPEDVQKAIFDFLPETRNLWQKNGLSLGPNTLGIWFETLQQTRENEHQLLTVLNAS